MSEKDNYKVSATISIDVSANSSEQAQDAGRMQLHKLFKEPLLSDIKLDESTVEASELDK